MAKHILLAITLTTLFCLAPGMQQEAAARIELNEIEAQQPKITQSGNSIIVSAAMGKTVHIFNLIGMEVMTVRIDASEKKIDLSTLGKGIFPVKVGNVTKKIHIGGR